ncbi:MULTISPECIES: pertactin-like passenger domain-containing protein [unclassified Helicobacter]|uniref:pertactin-like passenger domain-containing protein n=1 Tax=unclassified Helicobacter TaxID=2593540 RepID=UPI000CF06D24|nr:MULTISPECIES: pertactin-like passenger domain-containing protein [unclassified Helicobacter]
MINPKKILSIHLIFFSSFYFSNAKVSITENGNTINVTADFSSDKNFLINHKNQILKSPNQIVNITGSGILNGGKNSLYGALANATNKQVQNFNGQTSIDFTINSTNVTGDSGALFFAGNGGTMTFETNLSIRFASNSNIGSGVFLSADYQGKDPNGNDQVGIFNFNKGLIVDTTGVAGNRYIFNLNQKKAEMYVNYNKNNDGNAIGNPTIQLIGDIHLNGQNAILGINLNNNNSYLIGKEDFNIGNFNLGLRNGGKWIVTSGNVHLNNLSINNIEDPNNNPGINSTDPTSQMSMIDIATQRIAQGFISPQTININTLSGNNGVFRIMVNLPQNQGDLITIQNKSNGDQTHYIQVLQNSTDLDKITQGVSLKVAEIINGGDDLTFNALPATIGLYVYTPQLSKERQDNGYRWVIYQKKDDEDPDDEKPAEVQDSLVRWLSLQYRIFRIQTDSINKHIDELVFTRTKHNIWANYFLGKQSYKKSSDNYQTFQSGYDWGMNAGSLRHFVGGFFDYTKMKDYDIDYNGEVDSIGFGSYYQATYFFNKKITIDFDAKVKYTYNSINYFGKNNLSGADFLDSYHLFFMGVRLGSKIGLDRKNIFFLEPSAQAGIGFLNGGYVNIVDQLTQRNFGAQQDSANITSLKTNLSFGGRSEEDGIYWDIRGKVYYAYDSNTGGNITLIDVNPANRILFNTVADHRMGIGIDANVSFNNIVKLYTSLERTFFSNYNTDYLLYLGLRISFNSDGFKSVNGGARSGGRGYDGRKGNQTQTRRQGKVVFGKNARPLPKIINEE